MHRIAQTLSIGSFAFLAFVVAARGDDEGLKANLDLPYSAAGGEEDEDEALTSLTLYGQRYEGNAVVFCVDRSMSLGDGAWAVLQNELLRNIRDFDESVEFALVFFDSSLTMIPESRRLTAATAAAKQSAEARILALEPRDWTCLLAGLSEALDLIQRSRARRRMVLLLSDGKPLCPGHDPATYRARILEEARARNFQRVPIHTLSVGSDVDFEFLCQLARQSSGSCAWIGR